MTNYNPSSPINGLLDAWGADVGTVLQFRNGDTLHETWLWGKDGWRLISTETQAEYIPSVDGMIGWALLDVTNPGVWAERFVEQHGGKALVPDPGPDDSLFGTEVLRDWFEAALAAGRKQGIQQALDEQAEFERAHDIEPSTPETVEPEDDGLTWEQRNGTIHDLSIEQVSKVLLDAQTQPAADPIDGPLSWDDLRNHGLLWLINTTTFHPRGLALALYVHEEGEEVEGWKMLAAEPGEAMDYLPLTPSTPHGIDIDMLYRRVEAYMANVRRYYNGVPVPEDPIADPLHSDNPDDEIDISMLGEVIEAMATAASDMDIIDGVSDGLVLRSYTDGLGVTRTVDITDDRFGTQQSAPDDLHPSERRPDWSDDDISKASRLLADDLTSQGYGLPEDDIGPGKDI